MLKSLMCAVVLSAALVGGVQAEDIDTAPVVYSLEVYRDNTLVFGQDVTAQLGESMDVVVAPQGDLDVGLVGYVWPVAEADGSVRTHVSLDADWVDLTHPDAIQTARVDGELTGHTDVAVRGVMAMVGDYQVVVVQKTP